MDIELIWKDYHKPLQKFIEARVSNNSEVDDILQKVFIKIYSHLPDLKNNAQLVVESWIYQIARNTIIDFYRTKKLTERISDDIPLTNEYNNENFTYDAAQCIRSTINKLPDKYREALEIAELQGISQKELSKKLGISYSGAKSRVQRGREKLKTLLLSCCHIKSDRYGNIVDFQILKDE
jgi:RNA polymerase sigma-70 factor (ECF subfamily)